ncbi:MAG: PilW family protein, partial [Nitrospiria bacterium]
MAYLKTESAQRSNRCLGARFNRAGFTMIEILVSLAVFGIVITGVYQVYLNFNSHATAQEEVAEMQQNVRVAINQITRELRSAGYRFGSPVDGIITSSPQSTLILDENTGNFLTIQGDFDNNNVIEKVTYAISCTEVPCEHPWLMRTYDDGSVLNPPSERFAANIEEVEFKLYDKNNGPETVASNAKRVTVKLRGRTDRPDPDWPSDGGYRLRTVSADVILRNFELSTGDITPPVCPTTTGVTAVAGECG